MIDYNNKGIQLFILAHTPQSKLQSGEYIKSIVEYVKFIKNGYGIEFKAIPLDAESLKRMSMDPKNRIKEFPTILYAKSFYFGINNIKKLLLDLCRALEVKQKQVQAEANIVNPIDLNDIMKNTLESNDPDDINSENMQSKMSRFNRQRETVFEQKANSLFQGLVGSYVTEEKQLQRPVLSVLNATIDRATNEITLSVGNSGQRPSEKTSIAFTEAPVPIAKTMGINFGSVPNGQQRNVNFNLFIGQDIQTRLPENKQFDEMKVRYADFRKKYEAGEMAAVIHLDLVYEFEGRQYKTSYGIIFTPEGDFAITSI